MKSVTALLFLAFVASTMAVYVVNNGYGLGYGYGSGLGYYGGVGYSPIGYGGAYINRGLGYYGGAGYYGNIGYGNLGYGNLGYGMGYWKK